MTDARVTQAPALVPAQGDDETRVTQGAALALGIVKADETRETQAPALVLNQGAGAPSDGLRVSQSPIMVLAQCVPCATYWAQAWRIERLDGTVFTYTDHDRDLPFRGETYSPCESLAASAADLAAFAGEIGSQSLAGIVADAGIAERDLVGGLFDGAKVEVWLVPWSQIGGQIPRRLFAGTIEGIEHGLHGFTAEVQTPGAKLQQRAVLEHFTAACRWQFGTLPCPVDLGPLTVTGSVTNLPAIDSASRARKRIFRDSSRIEAGGHFDLGLLTWTSGANNGLSSEVKSFAADGTFTLWNPMPAEIAIGDGYSVYPGCNKTEDDHVNKFGLTMEAYGGFPHIPSRDVMSQTPDSK